MTTIILLFGLGLALVVAEIFIPSGGLLGLLVAISILGALGKAFLLDASTGIALLAATAVLVPIIMTFGIRMFPHTPMGRRLTMRGFSFKDGEGTDRRDLGLAGRHGVVESTLRPAGIARIDGRRVDVVSRGEQLDVGAAVEVVEVSGNRVIVSAVDSSRADVAATS